MAHTFCVKIICPPPSYLQLTLFDCSIGSTPCSRGHVIFFSCFKKFQTVNGHEKKNKTLLLLDFILGKISGRSCLWNGLPTRAQFSESLFRLLDTLMKAQHFELTVSVVFSWKIPILLHFLFKLKTDGTHWPIHKIKSRQVISVMVRGA